MQVGWGGAEPDPFGGTNGYIDELGDGLYYLADWQLCYQGPVDCSTHTYLIVFFTNNNKMVINVRSGDALLLSSRLYDFDDTSADDAICNADLWVGPRDLQDWAATENEGYNLIQPEGEATCNLLVILNAVPPGQ